MWPLLAGAVTAVGVFAASRTLGVVVLLCVYAALSVFAVTVVWGLSLETGIDSRTVVRWGLYSALVVVVGVGLSALHPLYGLLVGVAVGLGSPTALTHLATVRPRTRKPPTERAAPPAPGVLMDRAMLDRRFDDIVHDLRASGDSPES
jgi:hypothetical protein